LGETGIEIECPWRCGICRAVCAEGAVAYRAAHVCIDKSACSGCQACARACPAGLIGDGLD
jgi:MinD superfamily P-loop ATPase